MPCTGAVQPWENQETEEGKYKKVIVHARRGKAKPAHGEVHLWAGHPQSAPEAWRRQSRLPKQKKKKKKIAREKDQKAHGDEDINFSLTMYL